MRRNGRDAPIADPRRLTIWRPESTQLGHSASHSERLFLPKLPFMTMPSNGRGGWSPVRPLSGNPNGKPDIQPTAGPGRNLTGCFRAVACDSSRSVHAVKKLHHKARPNH
jgi:hypothetical protein